MPPKKEVKKGGAPVPQEEDLSDLASLPMLNMFGFTLCLDFDNKDNQLTILKAIEERLAENEKIKQISKEELITYGKAKGTISEEALDDLL
jgi:hypothetical protein